MISSSSHSQPSIQTRQPKGNRPAVTRSFFLIALLLTLTAAFSSSGALNAMRAPFLVIENTTMRLEELPEGTAGMMAEYVPEAGVVYILGGYRTSGASKVLSKSVWAYDPLLDSLSVLPDLPYGLALAGSEYVASEGKIYLFSGLDDEEGPVTLHSTVRAYNVKTGELEILHEHSNSEMTGTHNSAVYVPDQNKIYTFFGGPDEVAPSFPGGIPFKALNLTNGTYENIGNAPSIDTANIWQSAHLVSLPYPMVRQPEPADETDVLAGKFILLLGTKGYAIFNPETQGFVEADTSNELYHPRGGSAAFIPGLQEVFMAGGKRNFGFCTTAIVNIDPRLPVEQGGFSTDSIGTIPAELGTHSDGAAVYVSDLDRVILFGGFQAPADCNADWPLAPTSAYHTGIYSLSPEYDGGWGQAGLIPTNILNPGLGAGSESNPVKNVITVHNEDPPGGTTEKYVVAIQAAFLDEDGIAVPRMQSVSNQSFSYNSNNPQDSTFAIDIPENIAPSPSNMSGEQIVGLCLISTFNSFQRIPNCREIKITLDPGDLQGTIFEDLTGIGQGGSPALEGALVELIDVDGDVIAELMTGPDGKYDFCPGAACMAIGKYTLNVTKPYVDPPNPADRYIHSPTAVPVEVTAGSLTTRNIVLETTLVLGPEISKLTASHNGLYGDQIGTFLSFDHWEGMNNVPNQVPRVMNTFRLDIKRFLPDRTDPETDVFNVSKVSVNLNGSVQEARSLGNGQYEVTYNMSEVLTAGSNPLVITAEDSQNPPSTSERTYTVMAEPAKPTKNGKGTEPASYVDLKYVAWNPLEQKYESVIIVPSGLRWPDNPPHVLDLELVELYSQFRADIEIHEEFSINAQESAEGDGAILVQILATSPDDFALEERFEVTPIFSPDGTNIESYLVESDNYDLCQLGLPKCGEWITLYGISESVSYEAGPAEFSASFTMHVAAQYAATMRLEGTLRGDDYTLKKIRIIPEPQFALQAKGEAEVSASIDLFFTSPSITIGGGVEVTGRLYYAQPIVYEPDRSNPVYLDNPCIRFVATAHAWASLPSPFPDLDTGDIELVDVQEGDACSSRGFDVVQTLPEPPDLLPMPAVALSADRSNKLSIWIEEGTSNGMTVNKIGYLAVTNGTSSSDTIPTTGTVMDPAVAFTSNDSAIAVWSQLDPNAVDPTNSTITQILATQEIYSSVWTESGGWQTPVRLTNDSSSDGKPVITADPATGKALVAWMRDSDANPESKVDLSIVTRHWNGTGWDAEQTVANDPTSQDSQPVISYNTDGSEAWVLWTRDHDGNFNTNPDRKLAYAIWNGSSWSAVVEPSNWPTGAYNGQMVFSSASDKPLVTMIVLGDLGKDDAGNDLGQATIGKEGRLYAAWHGASASGWDVQSVHDTRAESAQPILASPNRALILMRNFGGGGTDGYPSAGRMAISAGEINPDGARWVAPGLLTEGELPVWQVQGISVPLGDPSDADFGINFVGVEQDTEISNGRAVELARGVEATVATADHVRATNLAGTNQTKILDFETATNGADLMLEPLEFSNLAPLPGEVVVVTATVRSKTVRPMSWTDGGPQFRITLRSLRDGLNENIQLHTELVPVDLLFNETETVVMSYRSTGDSGRILAQVSFTGDIDTSNNDYYQRVGEHTAPLNLAVNELFDKTTLSWDPPLRQTSTSWFYHIYRGPSAEGPWTFYDLSKQPEYTDHTPDDDNSYYAVEAFDQYKQRSDQVVGTGSEPPLLPLTTGETQVSFSTSEALVHETGGNAMLTVNLSEPLLTQVTVDYAASSGTATVGSDLANASGTITFNPGETVKMISIPITNDNNNEGNETFVVTLSNSIGTLIGSKSTVTVEIMDDDDGVPDAPSVSLSAADATVSENAGELIVTVNLSNAWTQAVTVKIGTSSGTADSGSDFGGQSQTLTFVPGVTSRTLTIPIINDNWVETSETFTVTLSDPAGMTLGSVSTTTVTILDDGDTKTPGEDVYLPLIVR